MARLERLAERLDLKEFQLRALLDITKAINNNLGRRELLRLYEDITREQLGISRLMLFERTDAWKCVLSYGASPDEIGPEAARLFSEVRDIRVIAPDDPRLFTGFDVAVPVFHLDRPLAFLLIGDLQDEERHMSPTVKHLNFIQTLTNLIVVALENKRLLRQALQQERDRRELELAAEMQSMLIPTDLPRDERIEAAAWYLPHRQVGGDYYDLIVTTPDERVIAIADVSGKGMAAALLMSNFQATLRALLQYTEEPLDELVHDLNDKVFVNARGERFVTLFLGRLDLRTGLMRYVNAGHNAPLLHHGGKVQELTTGCIGLGMLEKLPFLQVGEVTLPRGSTLLCYTDGLVEQEDSREEPFGTQPLRKALTEFSLAGAEALNSAIIGAFEAHRAGLPYLDDIALLTCCLR
ncbi:MAG: SpoIIE family protein phosphatase [Flavobacteriales bacterium]|nr:SpoIIE family protein phosphatase [Flavobacteriales bacterium]